MAQLSDLRELGIDLPEEVLPNIPAIVPPFFLAPNEVFALEA
jgi:hypothetical protein